MKTASLGEAAFVAAHGRAQGIAGLLRLPLQSRAWRGAHGNWQGHGTGSSIDFQDHRPYSPGDDPRHINWQAYARSGQFTMKLYRQEVSPAVDVVIDLSASMFLDREKAERTAELLYWCVESAGQAGAALRCFALRGASVEPLALDEILAHTWPGETASAAEAAALRSVPWRHGSLRVFISDLLWPGDAQPAVQSLTDGNGSGLLLAPFCREEAEPRWSGNLEMLDCESRALRVQRVTGDVLERYRAAWRRHFELWAEQALRHRVPLAQIDAGADLAEALRAHVPSGAVEWAA